MICGVTITAQSCLKKSASSGAASSQSADPTVDESTGKKIFKVDPAKGATLSASGINSKDPSFARTSVAIPPGALSLPVNIAMFESTPIVNTATQASLGVTGAAPAGPSVAITPSQAVTISGSLQISLPYHLGASLSGNDNYVVFGVYPVGAKFEVETFVGDELTFDGSGVIKVGIKRFGAFQVARTSAPIAKKTAETSAGFVSQKEAESNGTATYMSFYVTADSELPSCDATRVSHLYYVLSSKQFQVCNGSGWSVIDMAPPKVVAIADLFSNSPTSAEVTVEGQKRTRTTTTYSATRGGPVVRTCFVDLWATPINGGNGSSVETQNGGDPMCSIGGSKMIVCDAGFKSNDVGCTGAKPSPDNHNLIEQYVGFEPRDFGGISGNRSTYRYLSSTAADAVLVRTCFKDNWTKPIENGSIYIEQRGGDDGCSLGGTKMVSCSGFFAAQGNTCVATCAPGNLGLCTNVNQCQNGPGTVSNNGSYVTFWPGFWENAACQTSCSVDKIPTSRGCETPVNCSFDQSNKDNVCTDIVWDDTPTYLLGDYTKPTKIKVGIHTVKGDVVFTDAVSFEPGAIMEFDGNFKISTQGLVYANGTSENHIVFRGQAANSANPYTRWAGFSFGAIYSDKSIPKYSMLGEYRSGNKFSFVDFYDSACENSVILGFTESLTIQCPNNQGNVSLTGHSKNAEITAQHLNSYNNYGSSPSVFEKLSLTGGMGSSNTIILSSTISGYLSLGEKSILAFSEVGGVHPSSAYILGNKITDQYATLPQDQGLQIIANSRESISERTAVIALASDGSSISDKIMGQINKSFSVHALALNKDGWIKDQPINWESSFDATCGPLSGPSGTGATVWLTAAVPNVYDIRVARVGTITDLIGRPVIRANILGDGSTTTDGCPTD